jgi:hypothetical protein
MGKTNFAACPALHPKCVCGRYMKIINLLPKSRQEELRYEILLHSLWFVIILSLLSFALVFLAQFGAKFYLQYEAVAIKDQISQLQIQVNQQQNADIKTKIQAINGLISDYNNLAGSSPKLSRVVKAFAPLTPAGVKINSFNVNPANKTINISGTSPTRDLVIKLYNNILLDTKDFSNIDYPLENVVEPTNVNFHFTFNIQDGLLK